jgi:hypothetical protein
MAAVDAFKQVMPVHAQETTPYLAYQIDNQA